MAHPSSTLTVVVGNHALLQPSPHRAQAFQEDPAPASAPDDLAEPSRLGMFVTLPGGVVLVRSAEDIWALPCFARTV